MLSKLMKDDKVISIFEYGSVVYGTFSEKSDKDYIVVVTDDYDGVETHIGLGGRNVKYKGNDYNFYTETHWNTKIEELHIEAMECAFMDSKHILKGFAYNIFIDDTRKVKLRQRISSVCSNSYDKARKKLTIEKDFAPRIAKKSLWHSMRIMDFGKQLMKFGVIINFESMNHLYDEIVNCEIDDWKYYKDKYHTALLASRSEFRELSQPEWNVFKYGKE